MMNQREYRSAAAQFRDELASGPVIAMGIYDGVSARLAARAGFSAVFMGSFDTEAALLGKPDLGYLTMTECVDHARRLVAACGLPLGVDIDDGFGSALNVGRAVAELATAGVALVMIQDQVVPKRPAVVGGTDIITRDEFMAKVGAALDARGDNGPLVVARTDALESRGLEEVRRRADDASAAGADMIYVGTRLDLRSLELVAKELAHLPLMTALAFEVLRVPGIVERVLAMGYQHVVFPTVLMLTAAKACEQVLTRFSERPSDLVRIADRQMSLGEFDDLIGMTEALEALEASKEGA